MINTTISGYVAKKGVEIKTAKSGKDYAVVGVKVSTYSKNEAMFAKCMFYGKMMETVKEYVSAGKIITVVGRPSNYQILPPQEEGGRGLVTFDLMVQDFQLPPNDNGPYAGASKPATKAPVPSKRSEEIEDDDIPF